MEVSGVNVLVTGGYGFIGSSVVERFHKEGHRVYIIDNLSTGRRERVTVPHKAYAYNVEDRACEEVFRSVGFDVVVHLAAQTSVMDSLERPCQDAEANVLGLVNMLNCARLHGVKKFIFASSAAVYGDTDQLPAREETACHPLSPYGMNKRLGEMYCEKWQELYKLDTLCLRFSNVYGPRQSSSGEGGVISVFLNQAREGKPLYVFGDGTQTRDFVYVDDVTDAIYRGATSDVTGIYNVSMGRETSVNELIETIRTLVPVKDVQYLDSRPGEIARSCLDNSRLKRDLDWVPLYSLQEGIAKTWEWMLRQEAAAAREEAAPARETPGWWRIIRPFVENGLAFAAVALLSRDQSGFLYEYGFDFRLVYILLIGLMYGSRQSFLSASAVISLYVADSLANGRDWGSLLFDPETLFVAAVYLFFGLSVGFVTDKYKKELAFAKNELAVEAQRYKLLMDVYKDTRSVKEALQRQVLTNRDSLGRIHALVTELESLEPEQVVGAAVNVMEDLMESRKISIYAVSATGYLRLLLQSNDADLRAPRSLHLKDVPELSEVVTSQRLWVNKKLVPGLPMLAAPVVHQGETIALVCVHEQGFERFTLYHENLFRIAVDMISRSLSRAFTYVAATRSERFVEETPILQEGAFLEVLRSKQAAKERYQAAYTLLHVEASENGLKEAAERLSRLLRDTDYIGLWRGRLVLLLSNSGPEEARAAMERLQKYGVATRLVSEDAVYA
jgi:UDP-glucuronate decarboxylase